MKCEVCLEGFRYSLDKHHIHSKSLGGSDYAWNIALLCPNCHRDVHRGFVIIEGRFFTNNGDLLIHRRSGEPSITGEPDPPCFITGVK